MNDFFITSTGKRIVFENNLQWSLIDSFKEQSVLDKIEQYSLSQDKFDLLPPTISEVEDAIARQLPYVVLDNIHHQQWFSVDKDEDKEYNKTLWESHCNEVSIKIPHTVWDAFDVSTVHSTYGQRAFTRKFKMVSQNNNSRLFMTSYRFWLAFFKFEDNEIKYCILSNSRTYLDPSVQQKELNSLSRYFSILPRHNKSVQIAKVNKHRHWASSHNITVL